MQCKYCKIGKMLLVYNSIVYCLAYGDIMRLLLVLCLRSFFSLALIHKFCYNLLLLNMCLKNSKLVLGSLLWFV